MRFRKFGISLCQLKKWKNQFGKANFILPWDEKYDYDKTVYNRDVNQFPLFIIYVTSICTIQLALGICKKYDIPFVIRSGGHDLHGWSTTENVIIDVSLQNKIKIVEDEVPYVIVGSGVTMGHLLEELAKESFCTATGTCATVSCGLQLGGGIGFLQRKFGLSCDSVLEVGIVLADGEYIKANAHENKDLFFALKGSGHNNYGVVSDIKLRIHPIHDVVLFELYFTMDKLEQVIKKFQDTAINNPDHNFTAELDLYDKTHRPAPILITGQYVGHIKTCDGFLDAFNDLNPIKKIWKTDFLSAVKHFSTPHPNFFLSAASFFVPLFFSDDDIAIIRKWMERAKPDESVEISPMGGAITDSKKNFAKTSCFAWRDSNMWFYIRGGTKDQSKMPLINDWNYGFYKELSHQFINPDTGVPRLYVNMKPPLNLIKNHGEAFYGKGYIKLREIKTKYDPSNLFSYRLGVKGI